MSQIDERWKNIAPQFEARELLELAAELLERAEGGAPALRHVRQALVRLHPLTAEPGAREEYEQRKAGTYEPPPAPVDPKDAELAALRARVAELEEPPTLDYPQG